MTVIFRVRIRARSILPTPDRRNLSGPFRVKPLLVNVSSTSTHEYTTMNSEVGAALRGDSRDHHTEIQTLTVRWVQHSEGTLEIITQKYKH